MNYAVLSSFSVIRIRMPEQRMMSDLVYKHYGMGPSTKPWDAPNINLFASDRTPFMLRIGYIRNNDLKQACTTKSNSIQFFIRQQGQGYVISINIFCRVDVLSIQIRWITWMNIQYLNEHLS